MTAISNDMQAIVTGALCGFLYTEQAKYAAGSGFMKLTDVQPEHDDDGNYTNTIMLTFESGLRLGISVSEVTEIIEE